MSNNGLTGGLAPLQAPTNTRGERQPLLCPEKKKTDAALQIREGEAGDPSIDLLESTQRHGTGIEKLKSLGKENPFSYL